MDLTALCDSYVELKMVPIDAIWSFSVLSWFSQHNIRTGYYNWVTTYKNNDKTKIQHKDRVLQLGNCIQIQRKNKNKIQAKTYMHTKSITNHVSHWREWTKRHHQQYPSTSAWCAIHVHVIEWPKGWQIKAELKSSPSLIQKVVPIKHIKIHTDEKEKSFQFYLIYW